MHLLFIDEAGCPGALKSCTDPVQPVFVISGLIVESRHIGDITKEYLALKKKFNPHVFDKDNNLDIAKWEVKGSELRKDIKSKSRNKRRRAIGFLNKVFDILDDYECRLLSKAYVKKPGDDFDGKAVYTSTAQSFCQHFNVFLEKANSSGIVVCDSRNYSMNSNISHSVFTQQYSRGGSDKYARLIEMPLFGHSDNHALLQLVDLLSSAIVFPSCTFAYCLGHVNNVHVSADYVKIRDRFCGKIKELSFRYQEQGGRWRGGVTVLDNISRKSAKEILSSS